MSLLSRMRALRRRASRHAPDAMAPPAPDAASGAERTSSARAEQVEDELAEFARLAPMNLLASTLAHELGQPLAAVANYVSGAHRLITEGDAPKMHLIEEALTAAAAANQRSSDIVRSMRSMISSGGVNRQAENLVNVIQRASLLAMADNEDADIDYRIDVDPDVDTVYVDRVQLEQILINLLRNARDAIAPMPVRRIALAASRAGSEVNISVSDSGPGVAPELVDKLFQVFKSTKREGLGIGLLICRTMVEANGGRIGYAPAPGGGAYFTVTLPEGPV